MTQPVAIDLFCGKGGWTIGLQSVGYHCIGFDVHNWGYPGELVLQDVATLDGRQFRSAKPNVIVASPPCQAYSYRAMPWKRAKALPPPDNTLFEACFRIAAEAECPLVVENVRGAQKWVGPARWHMGSMYLWGDLPALMPVGTHLKGQPGSWFSDYAKRKLRDGNVELLSMTPSHSQRRREASARIAMIPFDLARHIGECFL